MSTPPQNSPPSPSFTDTSLTPRSIPIPPLPIPLVAPGDAAIPEPHRTSDPVLTDPNRPVLSVAGHLGVPARRYILAEIMDPIRSQIDWKVYHHPSTAKLRDGFKITRAHLLQAATVPAITSLVLHVMLLSEHMIVILPSCEGGYVTVGDVIDGVYQYFRQPIPEDVLGNLEPGIKRRIRKAHHRRNEESIAFPRRFASDGAGGPRYVDFLIPEGVLGRDTGPFI